SDVGGVFAGGSAIRAELPRDEADVALSATVRGHVGIEVAEEGGVLLLSARARVSAHSAHVIAKTFVLRPHALDGRRPAVTQHPYQKCGNDDAKNEKADVHVLCPFAPGRDGLGVIVASGIWWSPQVS